MAEAEKKGPAKTKVIVEAVKRNGFAGFYCLGRLFPNATPVEIEVTTEDIYKKRKVTDSDTDEVSEERYLFRESELKQLKRHSHFLKLYAAGSTPMTESPVVPDKSEELEAARKKAIDEANAEATGENGGDKGPTGRIV